jgi:membrane fusion protein (multidrug efflux system)
MMAEKSPLTGKLRVIIPAILLGIGVIIGLRYGISYWIYSMKHVSTDDARVKGHNVALAPEVSGVVKVLHVEEGTPVKAGDVLLEIVSSGYQSKLEEAQANAEIIERQLQESKQMYDLHVKRAGSRIAEAEAEVKAQRSTLAEQRTNLLLEKEQMQNEVVEAEAALHQAEAAQQEIQGQVRSGQSNWERAQALFSDGIISVEGRDDAQEALVQAKARVAAAQELVAQRRARRDNVMAARKRLRLLERKVQTMEAEVQKAEAKFRLAQTEEDEALVLKEEQRVLEARLREAMAKVQQARDDVESTVLRSPITGVISRQRVEEGQLIQRGQPVLVIHDLQDVWVLANIKESYISDVSVGSPVEIWVDAYPDRRFEGKVLTVGAAAISEFSLFPPTGTFTKVEQRLPVQISVPNDDGLLKPGMMVVVGIVRNKA